MKSILKDKWFVAYDSKQRVLNHGIILGETIDGSILIQFYDALVGMPSNMAVIKTTDLRNWKLFMSAEEATDDVLRDNKKQEKETKIYMNECSR